MKYILVTLGFLTQISCAQEVNHEKLNIEKALFRQHAFLIEKSIKYDEVNSGFKYSVQKFIDTCTEYNNQFEKRIKPFEKSKIQPIILLPYLFNNSSNKVILLVLTREDDLEGKPVDYVHFVLGDYKATKWFFKLKERYVRSFSYENNYPLLSDTEIFLRILRTFIDQGYMSTNALTINDSFFSKEW